MDGERKAQEYHDTLEIMRAEIEDLHVLKERLKNENERLKGTILELRTLPAYDSGRIVSQQDYNRMRDENERLKAIADGIATLEEMHANPEKARVQIRLNPALQEHVLSCLASVLIGAPNYVEAKFEALNADSDEFITVTVKRGHGKTPHQMREDAEAKCERLKEQLSEAKRAEGLKAVLHECMLKNMEALLSDLRAACQAPEGVGVVEMLTHVHQCRKDRDRLAIVKGNYRNAAKELAWTRAERDRWKNAAHLAGESACTCRQRLEEVGDLKPGKTYWLGDGSGLCWDTVRCDYDATGELSLRLDGQCRDPHELIQYGIYGPICEPEG